MLFGRRARDRDQAPPEWEAVWQGDSEGAANVVAGSLRVDGINARVHGGRMISLGLPAGAPGGNWAVFAPSGEAARARDFLLRRGDGPNVVSAPGADDDELRAATLKFALAALLAVAALSLVLMLRG